MTNTKTIFRLSFGFALAGLSSIGHTASFDCSKARGYAEISICTNPNLSYQDDELSQVYKKAKLATGNTQEFKNLVLTNWQRRQKCTSEKCLYDWYDKSTQLYEKITMMYQSNCVRENQQLKLSGTLLQITYPGPPEYESIANGDRPETAWVLQPDQKIKCAINFDGNNDYTKMQLVMFGNEYRDYKSLVGKNVIIDGTLMYADNAHHHTPLLIEVKRIAAK
ncbi:DUF4431 domain-containing protein [Acinetobacter sp. B5B]|uniref:DUF4431 domain-containing protein n=1 Tax=Acinetobacter baretiae TaxID=2605383 RepID=UPI0018C26EB3|nr:DUF4431 domain-containing protein [Acinetobacter baretiae]MBF7682974.1 DUF4431 domain-containing protein [Acinetobacter baretiae]